MISNKQYISSIMQDLIKSSSVDYAIFLGLSIVITNLQQDFETTISYKYFIT